MRLWREHQFSFNPISPPSKLLVLLLILQVPRTLGTTNEFPCSDESWTYVPNNGQCYKVLSGPKKFNWSEGQAACASALAGVSNISVGLTEVHNDSETNALIEFLVKVAVKEKIWLGAKREGPNKPFTWNSSGDTAFLDFVPWSGGLGLGNCMIFFYENQRTKSEWKNVPRLNSVGCDETYAVVCSHRVADCVSPPGGFISDIMVFTPTPPHVGVTTTVQCAPGYFPANSSSSDKYTGAPPVIDSTLPRGTYKCTGTRDPDHPEDPALFRTQFVYSGIPLQFCEEAHCELDIGSLCNALPGTISPQQQTRFKYGEQVFFDCETGYASAENSALSRTSMTCRTVPTQPQSGVWIPGPCQACVVTRCNETEMLEMVPQFAKLTGARSKLTEEQYGMLQVSQFNRFGNVVTFKCDDGYFFQDRTFQKFIECALVEGGTNLSAWTGYSGTLLPLPKSCTPVTCMYEEVLMKPSDKIQSNFTITFANGTQYTTSKLRPREYPYKTLIRYVCQDGYETITKDADQNITCGEMGKWRPQSTRCLLIPETLNTTAGGRYVPPLVEAPSASQIGAVVISIIVVFLVFLLLLDLATLWRDICWLFNNIRLQKRLWQAKRRIRAAKKAARMEQQARQGEECEKTE